MSSNIVSMSEMLSEGFRKEPQRIKKAGVPSDSLSPLEYMLSVMNDTNVDYERRDKMAIAAAPFVHPRVLSYKGKKECEMEMATEKDKEEKSGWGNLLTN